tara:strand:+ start:534 stop:746 length:213 start_codon:yes stop_codon:yes gene_type:complete
MADINGWQQYQKLVIDKLDSHDSDFKTIEDKLTSIQVEIATLKVKASIWGGLAGLIPVVLGIVLFFSQQG